MTDAKGQYQKLPPGWDCKYDQATGNWYVQLLCLPFCIINNYSCELKLFQNGCVKCKETHCGQQTIREFRRTL